MSTPHEQSPRAVPVSQPGAGLQPCPQCGVVPRRAGRFRCLSCGAPLGAAAAPDHTAGRAHRRDPSGRGWRREGGGEPLRLLTVIGVPGVIAPVAAWLVDPASALVLGLCVGALLGIFVKPRIVVQLLVSRGAARDSRWVPAHLMMRGAVTSAGFGCIGVGAGLLVAGPGMASVVFSSVAFGLGAAVISAAPDRSVPFEAQSNPQQPGRWSGLLDRALNADGWAGVGAGILCQPLAWASSAGRIPMSIAVMLPAVILGAWVPPVSRVVRAVWRFVLTRVPSLVERVPNAQWVRPGSIFYTWVPYDSPDEQGTSGKDRPVLCLTTVDGTYFAVALTSKDHTYRGDVIELGSGAWDPQRRKSYVKLRPIHTFTRGDVRRYSCQLDQRRFERVARLAREVNGSLPGDRPTLDEPVNSRIEWISPSARIVTGHAVAIWYLLLYLGIAVRVT
jgi:hypothetical protein